MSARPVVGILVSSYNHRRYLAKCLDSILNQTYQDFSIVIVDDGSQDGSHELIESYTALYPEKVHYVFHPGRVNRGISPSCNLGLTHIQSKYVAWIGSDDLWEPDKLEKQVAMIEQDPRLGFVYSRATIIDADGVKDPNLLGRDISKSSNPVDELLFGNWIPASSILIRQEALRQAGGFDENLIYSDWDLFIRIASAWKAGFLDEPLILYRVHGKNVSAGIDSEKNLRHNIEVLRALSLKAPMDRGLLGTNRTQALIKCHLSHHFFLLGRPEALTCFQEALACNPDMLAGLLEDRKWFGQWLEKLWLTHRFNPQIGSSTRCYLLWILLILQAIGSESPLEGEHPIWKAGLETRQADRRELTIAVMKTLVTNPKFWIRNPHLLRFFSTRYLGERITYRIENHFHQV